MPISRIGTDGIENGAVAPADLSTGGPSWDGSGNVGLQVTPSAWVGNTALQAGSFGAFSGGSTFGVALSSNAYSTTAGWSARYIGNSFATLYVQQQTNGQHAWYIAPSGTAGNPITFTQAMTLDAGGRLGLGTSSPQDMLVVSNAGNAGWEVGATSLVTVQTYNRAGSAYVDYKDNCLNRIFATNGTTERARITSDGNLLVGKTSSNDNVVGAMIRGTGYFTSTWAETTNAITTYHVYSTGTGGYRFYVGLGGTVFAVSTTISAVSDQRLKENIQDLDVGLDAVMALKPRKFDWKEGQGKDIKGDRGFIAQEFETVFPDLIDEWRDPAPEGEEPYKSVRQDLIPVLVKAIQELKAELDATKAEVAALKGAA